MDIHVTGNRSAVHSQSMSVCCVFWQEDSKPSVGDFSSPHSCMVCWIFDWVVRSQEHIHNYGLWKYVSHPQHVIRNMISFLMSSLKKGQQRSFCFNCHTCWSHGTVLPNHIYVHQILYQSWTFKSCHVTTREKINPNRIRGLIILLLKNEI